MGKTFRLTDRQREIVGIVSEAGGETLPTIVNTLCNRIIRHSPEQCLGSIQQALLGLVQLGFVALELEQLEPQRSVIHLTQQEAFALLALGTSLRWDQSRELWTLNPAILPTSLLYVVLTPAGKQA